MSGEQYDAPNQELVRPDGSGPADVGDGMGEPPPDPEVELADEDEDEQPTRRGRKPAR